MMLTDNLYVTHDKSVKENRDRIIEHNEFHLSLLAQQDLVVSFCFALSTSVFYPFLLVIYPVFNFAGDLLFKRRLSREQKDALLSRFEFKPIVLFRKKKKSDCHVHSIPFVSAIYFGEDILGHLDKPINRGNILHEIGHHQKYDYVMITWFRYAFFLWGILSAFILTIAAVAWLFPGIEGASEVRQTPVPVAFLCLFAVLILIVVFNHYGYIHKREFQADTYAYKNGTEDLLKYLDYKVYEESIPTQKRFLEIGFEFPTHPTPKKRLAVQLQGYPISALMFFKSTFTWALICCSLITLTIMINFTEIGLNDWLIEYARNEILDGDYPILLREDVIERATQIAAVIIAVSVGFQLFYTIAKLRYAPKIESRNRYACGVVAGGMLGLAVIPALILIVNALYVDDIHHHAINTGLAFVCILLFFALAVSNSFSASRLNVPPLFTAVIGVLACVFFLKFENVIRAELDAEPIWVWSSGLVCSILGCYAVFHLYTVIQEKLRFV